MAAIKRDQIPTLAAELTTAYFAAESGFQTTPKGVYNAWRSFVQLLETGDLDKKGTDYAPAVPVED